MKLHNISTHAKGRLALSLSKGFTLVEIMIVVAIISFLGVMGVVVGVDTYSRYIFRSDVDKIVSLLQKARSSAMNNINEEEYGVKIEKSETATWTDNCAGKIIFERLTGNANNCEIVITEGNKVSTITINNQGGINY